MAVMLDQMSLNSSWSAISKPRPASICIFDEHDAEGEDEDEDVEDEKEGGGGGGGETEAELVVASTQSPQSS